jgi:signal transduction histidine kinase
MRWALVKVCLAVTVMVVIAFAIPLALVVKDIARDRALSNAERQAAAVGPALAITADRQELRRAVASTQAGAEGRLAVHVPAQSGASTSTGMGTSTGTDAHPHITPAFEIGERHAPVRDLATARRLGRACTLRVPGGRTLLRPTAVASGEVAVVEVFVPEDEVTNGVATSWAVLAGVGVALIAGSVAFADRLGTRMVRPARQLADAAHDLGEGKLDVRIRVPEDGPSELRSAADAFNAMAEQVVQLLASERELAADLSHRLRTPLTVLRLNAASLGEGDAAEHTREAVAKLESEVDQIIRTAREQHEQRTQPQSGAESAACDAAEVIRERMAFWSALAEDEGREVRVAGVDHPVRVPVARAELAAALDAMLGNVFRHTAEGTAFAVDVHHGAIASNSVIVLVSDAGSGIEDPAAALRRGYGDGKPGSTGLGLDIVRRVAESSGGDVRVGRSVLGGTEVRVRLAPRGSAETAAQRRRARGTGRGGRYGRAPRRGRGVRHR